MIRIETAIYFIPLHLISSRTRLNERVVSLLYIVSQSWKQHAFVPAKWFFFYLSTMQEKNHCNSVATYMALLLILANGKANSIL